MVDNLEIIIAKISGKKNTAFAALYFTYMYISTWKVNILHEKSAEKRTFGIITTFEEASFYSFCQKVLGLIPAHSFNQTPTFKIFQYFQYFKASMKLASS